MGQYKPDTKYIYERVDGTVYAREFGAQPTDRFVVGQDYDSFTGFLDQYVIENEWKDIIKESRNNKVLQQAIERVKILYHLSKKDVERI